MPLLRLQTNIELTREKEASLAAVLSQKTSEWTDKPEAYVQVVLQSGLSMRFAGQDEPTAFVEIRSLGFFGMNQAEISQALCLLLQTEWGISQDRVFIHFFDLPRENWGWNGKTFA